MKRFLRCSFLMGLLFLAPPQIYSADQQDAKPIAWFHVPNFTSSSIQSGSLLSEVQPGLGAMIGVGASAALIDFTGIPTIDLNRPMTFLFFDSPQPKDTVANFVFVCSVTDLSVLENLKATAKYPWQVIEGNLIAVGPKTSLSRAPLSGKALQKTLSQSAQAKGDISFFADVKRFMQLHRQKFLDFSINHFFESLKTKGESQGLELELAKLGLPSDTVQKLFQVVVDTKRKALFQMSSFDTHVSITQKGLEIEGQLSPMDQTSLEKLLGLTTSESSRFSSLVELLPEDHPAILVKSSQSPQSLHWSYDYMFKLLTEVIGDVQKKESIDEFLDGVLALKGNCVQASYGADNGLNTITLLGVRDSSKALESVGKVIAFINQGAIGDFYKKIGFEFEDAQKSFKIKGQDIYRIDVKPSSQADQSMKQLIEFSYGDGIYYAIVKDYFVIIYGSNSKKMMESTVTRILDRTSNSKSKTLNKSLEIESSEIVFGMQYFFLHLMKLGVGFEPTADGTSSMQAIMKDPDFESLLKNELPISLEVSIRNKNLIGKLDLPLDPFFKFYKLVSKQSVSQVEPVHPKGHEF